MHSTIIPGEIRVEAAALRIRTRKAADPDFAGRPGRRLFSRVICSGRAMRGVTQATIETLRTAKRLHVVLWSCVLELCTASPGFAEIPWPEVTQRLASENE